MLFQYSNWGEAPGLYGKFVLEASAVLIYISIVVENNKSRLELDRSGVAWQQRQI